MTKVKIRSRGWGAAVALAALFGFVAFRWYTIKSTLATEATQELRAWLRADYSRQLVGAVDLKSLTKTRTDPRVQSVLDVDKIEFVSIGSRGADPVYVRAEIRVAGREPPDGKTVRYWAMQRSGLTGWKVLREISPMWYWMRLF